jgi:hypothetical protein
MTITNEIQGGFIMTCQITANNQFNSIEISFDSKPSEAIREALKALRFRWHSVKGVWYGYCTEEEARQAIEGTATKAAKATTSHERMKHRLYVDLLTKEGTKSPSFSSASLTSAYTPSLDHIVTFGLDQSGIIAENIEALKAIEQSEGRGSVAQKWAEEESFGPTGYGWQSKVNTKVVDESAMHFYAELLRTKELLQKAAKRATGDDKAHYQLLLRTIEQKLENK